MAVLVIFVRNGTHLDATSQCATDSECCNKDRPGSIPATFPPQGGRVRLNAKATLTSPPAATLTGATFTSVQKRGTRSWTQVPL